MKSLSTSTTINELVDRLKEIISEQKDSKKKENISAVRQIFKKQYHTIAKNKLTNLSEFGSNDK